MHQRALKALDLIAAGAAITSTTNHPSLDLSPYANIGRHEMKAILSAGAVGGTSPSFAVKIQDSPDNSTFTDISGASYAAITANQGATELHFKTNNRYVRAVTTVTGTSPTAVLECVLLAEVRSV